MYSKEFLESLGLDPALFDPDCEPESTKLWCDHFEDKNPIFNSDKGGTLPELFTGKGLVEEGIPTGHPPPAHRD